MSTKITTSLAIAAALSSALATLAAKFVVALHPTTYGHSSSLSTI
jgi:hypothetical protein